MIFVIMWQIIIKRIGLLNISLKLSRSDSWDILIDSEWAQSMWNSSNSLSSLNWRVFCNPFLFLCTFDVSLDEFSLLQILNCCFKCIFQFAFDTFPGKCASTFSNFSIYFNLPQTLEIQALDDEWNNSVNCCFECQLNIAEDILNLMDSRNENAFIFIAMKSIKCCHCSGCSYINHLSRFHILRKKF